MKILLLSTWFPYPPDQGSRIRAYHILRALASRHEVSLISFRDNDLQQDWIDHIAGYCAHVRVIERAPFAQSLAGELLGWLSLSPRAVAGNYSREMAAEVHKQVRDWQPDAVIALTYIAAMYMKNVRSTFRVADVDNLLSLMLYENFQSSENILQYLRRYVAYLKFSRFESNLYESFDLNLVTSDLDAERIKHYIPLSESQIAVVQNGVDLDYYRPGLYPTRPGAMVFNGALSYEPNFDAMRFFLKDIYPKITNEIPDASLSITGRIDHDILDSLPPAEQVHFTGYVEDIREVVARSQACVVPLRKGAGTRLKILEAMALGIPVITTSKGAEGLTVEANRHLLVADSAENFADAAIKVLSDRDLRRRISSNAVQLIRAEYGWSGIGAGFVSELEARIGDRKHVT